MTVSKKQLEANKKNAQKGGVETPEGKSIVKYDALKHEDVDVDVNSHQSG